MNGKIFNIQRFCTSDGPGIRTTVFLKGCPLSCIWCHNPESQLSNKQIMYNKMQCINCGLCRTQCPSDAHIFSDNRHEFIRQKCIYCFNCTVLCPTQALEVCGETKSDDEIFKIIARDAEFYAQSGGGITLSGGEPLFQYDFSLQLLKKSKAHGFHTAVETSGFCGRNLEEINRFTDLWLYDIKTLSESEHIKYTGVSNKIILKNLKYLDEYGSDIILRCPIIPNINMNKSHFNSIAGLAKSLKNICEIHFEPYHPFGIDKSERLGIVQKYDNQDFLSANDIKVFANEVHEKTKIDTKII